jgi:hypothetical protein
MVRQVKMGGMKKMSVGNEHQPSSPFRCCSSIFHLPGVLGLLPVVEPRGHGILRDLLQLAHVDIAQCGQSVRAAVHDEAEDVGEEGGTLCRGSLLESHFKLWDDTVENRDKN